MSEKSKAAQWDMDGESWRQDGDSFVLASRDGIPVPEQLTDLDYLVGAYRKPNGVGYLPRQFQYSPADGKPLQKRGTLCWLPPCGEKSTGRLAAGPAGSALASILERLDGHWRTTGRSMQDTAETIKPPAIDRVLYFCADAGGCRDALFALSRSGGLWLWQQGSRQWLPLSAQGARLPSHSFEHWNSAVVALPGGRGSDLILASDGGAECLVVDPIHLSYRLDQRAGKAVGAPGMLGNAALVPLLRDGGLRLAMRQPGSEWSDIPVEGEPAFGDGASMLAAPVGNVNGQGLLWIGERGWLSVDGQRGQVEASWNDWPDNHVARPILGPPFRDGSGDWQLLYGSDDGKWRYLLLDAAMPSENLAPRAAVGTGRRSFQFNVEVGRPWQDFDHDLHRVEHVLHPFLELEATGVILRMHAPLPARRTLTSFYDETARVPAQYGFSLPGDGRHHQYQLDVARPWNAQWFVHDDALWLWIDERGRLLRWNAP